MAMRIVVALLLLIHGLIHSMGFLKLWGLAEVPQLSGRTSVALSEGALRSAGVGWLVATLALVAAAVLRVVERDAWWMVALPAVAVSQALILLQWSDAKAGTVMNVLLVVPLALAVGVHQFHAASDEKARALLGRAAYEGASVVRPDELTALPPPVRRWIEASGAVGRPRATTVRLLQRGEMRTGPDQAYMHAEAKQYFTIDEPGFVWVVDVTMARVLPVVGRDTYVGGRGRMYITIGGLLPVADGAGPNFDQGTALRFLGEIVWFPSAALAKYITWEPIDDERAKATIAFGDVKASAVFEFDERGRFKALTAQRYYGGVTLETWLIPATAWRAVRGVEMPVRGGAVWKLASGDFDYYQWEILDVEVNPKGLWGDEGAPAP